MTKINTLEPQFARLKGGRAGQELQTSGNRKFTWAETFFSSSFLLPPVLGATGCVGGCQRTGVHVQRGSQVDVKHVVELCSRKVYFWHLPRVLGLAPPRRWQTQDTGSQLPVLHQALITVQWTLGRCVGPRENHAGNFYPSRDPFLVIR